MSDTVSVLTLDDQKEYIVLEQITKEEHTYYIIFENENPKNVQVIEVFDNKEFIVIDEEPLKTNIFKEFFKRHPEFQK